VTDSPQSRRWAALRAALLNPELIEGRATGALLIAAGLLVALTLALPHPATPHTAAISVLAVAMAFAGLVFLVFESSVRHWMVHAALGATVAVVGILIYASQVAAGQYGSIFVWVVLLSAYLFPRRIAFRHLAWLLGCYAVALSAVPETAGYSTVTRWILTAVSLSVVSALTSTLVAMRAMADEKANRFFELSVDMLCTADTDGYFVDLNAAWEKTLGYSEAELRSRPFVEFVHPEDRELTAKEAERLFAGGITVDFSNRYLAKDGSWRWLEWKSVMSPEDGLIYARATDVTERHRVEAERREAVAAMERANADLKSFAYVASHDLGEPLRTIAGFAQLLEKRYEDKVDEQGRDYIRRMIGGVDRMQTLIRDLLTFSRAGRDDVDRKPVDTADLVEEITMDLERAIRDADAEMSVGELPTVEADRQQLRQVFQNLISNAIKFQDGGRPRVVVSAQAVDGGWLFEVADNGIGIEPQYRDKIFDAFERLHGRDDYAGTGIGLAVCQRIVQRHGGDIHVEEGIDGGSRFVFRIADADAGLAGAREGSTDLVEA
jgi:PAS domain S-box-containing protein